MNIIKNQFEEMLVTSYQSSIRLEYKNIPVPGVGMTLPFQKCHVWTMEAVTSLRPPILSIALITHMFVKFNRDHPQTPALRLIWSIISY